MTDQSTDKSERKMTDGQIGNKKSHAEDPDKFKKKIYLSQLVASSASFFIYFNYREIIN
jgi:hypothetical protein